MFLGTESVIITDFSIVNDCFQFVPTTKLTQSYGDTGSIHSQEFRAAKFRRKHSRSRNHRTWSQTFAEIQSVRLVRYKLLCTTFKLKLDPFYYL